MDFSDRTVNGIVILDILGNLGITNIKEFKQRVLTFISQGVEKFILHFGNTNYIDSMGITALITLYTKLKEKGVKFKFAAVHGQVKQLLEISKLDKVFPIIDSLDQAIEDLK